MRPSASATADARPASTGFSRRVNRNGVIGRLPPARSTWRPPSPPRWFVSPRNWASRRRPSNNKERKLIMPKREVTTDRIRKPSGVFSQATVIEATGRIVFISGMTARRPDGTIAGIGNITEQTKQVLENIKSAVEAAGGAMDDVCRVDVYVRNMEHFKEIHAVRSQYFKAPLPASTMVEICKMTSPDYLIEINAIAVLPQ